MVNYTPRPLYAGVHWREDSVGRQLIRTFRKRQIFFAPGGIRAMDHPGRSLVTIQSMLFRKGVLRKKLNKDTLPNTIYQNHTLEIF